MEPLNPRSRVPLSRQIAASIRDQILSGDIPPGERIPSKREIRERYGVAANTADKAVRILKDEGYVETSLGLGLFVTEPDQWPQG